MSSLVAALLSRWKFSYGAVHVGQSFDSPPQLTSNRRVTNVTSTFSPTKKMSWTAAENIHAIQVKVTSAVAADPAAGTFDPSLHYVRFVADSTDVFAPIALTEAVHTTTPYLTDIEFPADGQWSEIIYVNVGLDPLTNLYPQASTADNYIVFVRAG